MPAASSKPDNKGSHEPLDLMKNVITVIEKKVRNLEKRKGKLDSYRELQDRGDKLNKDQLEAIAKYDAVILNLEFARELQKQFVIIQGETEKLLKKQAKKQRHFHQAQEIRRVQEVLQLQNTLDNMGSEDVREHFLNGTSGAVKLTKEELDHLDELYKLISPTRDGESSYKDQMSHASVHIVNFLEAKEKEVAGTTYKALKEVVVKINESGYFDKSGETEVAKEEEEEIEPAAVGEPAEETGKLETEGETYRPIEVVPAPVEQPEIHNNLLNHEPVSVIEENVVNDPHGNPHLGGQPVAPNNYTPEEESFFTTEAFPQPRPFQEIVSSVQGTFNFLQESQIMNEVAASDPAVIAATSTSLAHTESQLVQQVSYKSNNLLSNDAGLSLAPSQSSAVPSGLPTDSMGGAADHSGAATVPGGLVSQQPLDTFGSSGQEYFMASQQQPNTASGLSFMSEQIGGLEQGLGAASEVPPAIPMPNQTPMNMGGGGAAQEQMSEDKKPLFQMNPNAKMFRSMYSGQGQSGAGSNGGYSQSGAVGEDNFSQGHDYQGFGSNGYGQRSGGRGRGGPRGGRGGMSNGYSRGGRNGNPNGGYGGGRRDGGYSNGNSRGGGNRGSRGGPPRGGQMRGRGMSGGFGSGPRGNASSQASSQASA